MRASNKSPVDESLMKIFLLFCIINNIQFISCYFPCILNTYVDNLSRDVGSVGFSRRFKGQSMVGRAFAGGNLKELLANVHHRAVQSSLERSTQASASSAVKA